MGLKCYRAFTPSRRHYSSLDRSGLWKGGPEKRLTTGLHSTGGRNNLGRITVRHKGGGVKRRYRIIDFKRNKDQIPAIVERIEYDPNRGAFIALIRYEDSELAYIIAPHGLAPGATVISGEEAEVSIGNCLLLKNVPLGSNVHNIELKPAKGGQLARAAGTSAKLVGKEEGYVLLKLGSGEIRRVLSSCRATLGVVSNPELQNVEWGKAGRNRWRGIRPTVRGVAMNPVDHPLGGGEGKTSGGRHPVTPWGKCTKGMRTRRNKRTDRCIITSRHKSKK